MIKLIKSTFFNESETKRKLVDFILKSDVLSMSKECANYEKAFAIKQNRKYAVFVSSGSTANLVLVQALLNLNKLKKGQMVGFSALTWATNVMPLIQLGLSPIPIDCEIKTLNVSPDSLEPILNNLKCLFITNVLGFSDNIEKIANLCHENKILLLEDNCESLGSRAYGKLLGNFSMASTFSFFVGHHLSTIEGGMICTDNEELRDMMIMVRAHGWDRNLEDGKQQKLRKSNKVDDFYARYSFYDLAYNVRPSEINGFIGNDQLKYWDAIVEKRSENYHLFRNTMINNNDFIVSDTSHMEVVSNFAMPVVCKNEIIFAKYKNKFENNGVEIRPIVAGDITQQPFYKKYSPENQICKNADFIHRNGFYFGNNPELTEDEIETLRTLLGK